MRLKRSSSEIPFEAAKRYYSQPGMMPLESYLELYLRYGYVLSTPAMFVMARPVCRAWSPEDILDFFQPAFPPGADTWHVEFASGDLGRMFGYFPFPLRWISFERGDGRLRFH